MTSRMSKNTFMFFLLCIYICDLHNMKVLMKLKASMYILWVNY